jgi:hypothetical protein
MFAGCAINDGFDGGAEAVEQRKVAIVEIVGEAPQAKAAKPETGLQAYRQTRGATEIATLNAPGTAVIVSTAIAISEHITFPNDIAVSVTLTDGYTHRTATYSNLFSKYWHLCPGKYGGRGCN